MMIKFDELAQPHTPDVVLYHAECMDGFGAAWALWKRFPQARFVPVKHGFPQPDGLDNQHVVMVDFSYPRTDILALADCTASLQILDHHITAESALADLPFAYFDMDRSGAVLAWEWAHTQSVPWLLQYVQDKDLWRWQLPHSREISSALASYPFDFAIWEQFKFETLKIEGTGILRSENNLIDKLTLDAIMVSVAGYTVPAVHSPVLASQIGERLAADHAFGVIWHQKDGRRYFSLRSKSGGISVSEIAAQYGGGGHTHAAGFSFAIDDDSSPILNPISDLPVPSSLARLS
jgi:oligoribonuclease NrnB/cAMP/cGMP phosphodiesterase (DHH superfamily)